MCCRQQLTRTTSFTGNGAVINYLTKASPGKLPLIESNSEAFADVLNIISDYEGMYLSVVCPDSLGSVNAVSGVLARHESLAMNLGANLNGPRVVKAMEAMFEGGIVTSEVVPPHRPFQDSRNMPARPPPRWFEILNFIKSNPGECTLMTAPDGHRVCQFVMNNTDVRITEGDWRMIMSSVLDRFTLLPAHPLDEDEDAEIATLEILDHRVQALIKQADEVARKARQLSYHLVGRRNGINARRSQQPSHQPLGGGGGEGNFQTINQQHMRASHPNAAYDLRSDLLQQFSGPGTSNITTPTLPSPAEPSRHRTIAPISTAQHTPTTTGHPSPVQPSNPPSTSTAPLAPRRLSSVDRALQFVNPETAPLIALITTRVEKLSKGGEIQPACDRCRRLRISCIKNLTACQGCTKKHAKCSWKMLTPEEINLIRYGQPKPGTLSADPIPTTESEDDQKETDEVEAAEGAQALRELSGGRPRAGFTPPPTGLTDHRPRSSGSGGSGSGAGDRNGRPGVNHGGAEMAQQEEAPIYQQQRSQHAPHMHTPVQQQQTRLGHMAFVATAEWDSWNGPKYA